MFGFHQKQISTLDHVARALTTDLACYTLSGFATELLASLSWFSACSPGSHLNCLGCIVEDLSTRSSQARKYYDEILMQETL
jgi:hypothetical protein